MAAQGVVYLVHDRVAWLDFPVVVPDVQAGPRQVDGQLLRKGSILATVRQEDTHSGRFCDGQGYSAQSRGVTRGPHGHVTNIRQNRGRLTPVQQDRNNSDRVPVQLSTEGGHPLSTDPRGKRTVFGAKQYEHILLI